MGPGNDRRMIQITAPVQPGNSGGRVLDSLGNVVGVVEGWDVDFTRLGLSWNGGQRHDDGRHSAADCRRGRALVCSCLLGTEEGAQAQTEARFPQE